MSSFLSRVAGPIIQQVAEQDSFGKQYVRLSRLIGIVGYWVYQQGGVLGYALSEEPILLGKLMGLVPETDPPADVYLRNFRPAVLDSLNTVDQDEMTFFQIYIVKELSDLGIDIFEWPPSKKLNETADENFAFNVMRISYRKGAAFGYNISSKFTVCWERSYRIQPDSDWPWLYSQGLQISEKQPKTTLSEAITDMANLALNWAKNDGSGTLNAQELIILKNLAESSNRE
jgi:hypothetical protein